MCASRVFKKLLSLEYITEDERLVFLKLHYSTVLLILFFLFLFSCGPNFFFGPKRNALGTRGSWWLPIWKFKISSTASTCKKKDCCQYGRINISRIPPRNIPLFSRH
jgi:hypothetical protein